MKKVQFGLILSALVLLIVTQASAKTNSSFSSKVAPWDYAISNHAGHPAIKVPLRARTGKQLTISNNSKSLDDVTLLLSNDGNGRDYEIWLYPVGSDDYYYMDVPPYKFDLPLTVPAGTYDISIAPDDAYHHYIEIGCNITWGGFGPINFYGVSIAYDPNCNSIWYE